MTQVFTGQAADGVSQSFKYDGGGKALNVYLSNNLGGGTVTLEALLPDGSAWVSLPGISLTGAGLHVVLERAAPFIGRLRLSGSTSASLDGWVEGDSASAYRRVLEG